MTTQNKLNALEKASKKIQSAINNYNQIAGNPDRLVEVDRNYFKKAIALYDKIRTEHETLLQANWQNCIFLEGEQLTTAQINANYSKVVSKFWEGKQVAIEWFSEARKTWVEFSNLDDLAVKYEMSKRTLVR